MKEQSWLSKNWIWILLLLIAGFLIYVLFHKAKVVEFTKQKTIDSLYVVIHQLNKADTLVIDSLKKVSADKDQQLASTKEQIKQTGLKLKASTAQVQLLSYKLKHTAPGTPIDSADCIELAEKSEIQASLISMQQNNIDSLVVQIDVQKSLDSGILARTQSQLIRTDSALTVTKLAMDECATDNKQMVKQVKKQSLVTKIVAGLAIVFGAIVVSDHL